MDEPLTDFERSQLTGGGECFIHHHAPEVLDFYDRLDLMAATPNTSVSTNYTALKTDELILVDTTAGDVTITLPLAANGREFHIVKIVAANNVIVAATSPDTVNGAASISRSAAYGSIWLKSITGGYVTL